MEKKAVEDLINQYQRAFHILYQEMERFSPEQWVTGFDAFQVPVKIAMHIVDCLDYYFWRKTDQEYPWGHRFGGGWWELPKDRLPSQAEVKAYTQEIEKDALEKLSALQDGDLSGPPEVDDQCAATCLGRHVYILRHTMHHHGELSALAVYHGLEGGSWE